MNAENYNLSNLHKAIDEVAPYKASPLVLKYERVMDGISASLIKSKDGSAEQAQAYLGDIASQIVKARSNRGELIDAFAQELDNVSDSLSLKESIDKTDRAFTSVQSFADKLGMSFDVKAYKSAYLALPESFRIPIDAVQSVIDGLNKSVGGSDLLMAKMHEMQNDFFDVVAFLCNGNLSQAEKRVSQILDSFDQLVAVDKLRQKLDIKNLNNYSVNVLIGFLNANKISPSEALKYVTKIKAVPDFANLKLSSDEMIRFLCESIAFYKEGGKQGPIYVKRLTFMKAQFSSREAAVESKIYSYRNKLVGYEKDLLAHVKASGHQVDPHITSLKRNISILHSNMAFAQRDLQLNKAAYEVSIAYLAKNGEKLGGKGVEADLSKIMACRKGIDLERLVEKYHVDRPALLTVVQAMEAEMATASVQVDIDKWVHENPEAREAFRTLLEKGKLSPTVAGVVLEQLNYQLSEYDALRIKLFAQLGDGEKYMKGLPKSLRDIEPEKRQEVAGNVQAYMFLQVKHRDVLAKLIGVASSMEFLNTKKGVNAYIDPVDLKFAVSDSIPEGYDEVSVWVRDIPRAEDGYARAEIEKAGNFLGIKSENLPLADIDTMSISPLAVSLLATETAPFINSFTDSMGYVKGGYDKVADIPKSFERLEANPESHERMRIHPHTLFKSGLRAFDKTISYVTKARGNVDRLIGEMDTKMKNPDPALKQYPQFLTLREKMFGQAIANLRQLLIMPESPISELAMESLKDGRVQLNTAYEDYSKSACLNILAVAVIIAAAVATGVGAAYLAGMGSAALFGSAGTTGLLTVGSGTAAFATGAINMMAVAGGATIGQRFGAMGTNALGWSNMSVSWSAEDLSTDFFMNFGLSLAAVGSARAVMYGLRGASTSTMPILAGLGAKGLDKLKLLGKFSSPSEWFAGSVTQARRSALKLAGVRIGKEYGEEMVETGAETINPVLGFVLSVINSADGMNVELARAGINAKTLGIELINGKLTYTSADPETFIESLQTYFGQRSFIDVKVDVRPDASIELHIAGQSLEQSATIIINPSEVHLSPDVAIARIKGIDIQEGGKRSISNPLSLISSINELQSSGFVVAKTETGIRATKGVRSFEIEVNAGVVSDLTLRLKGIEGISEGLSQDIDEFQRNPSLENGGKVRLGLLKLGAFLGVSGVASPAFATDFLTNPKVWLAESIDPIAGMIESIGLPVTLFYVGFAKGGGFKVFTTLYSQLRNIRALPRLNKIIEDTNTLAVPAARDTEVGLLKLETEYMDNQLNLFEKEGQTLREWLSGIGGADNKAALTIVKRIESKIKNMHSMLSNRPGALAYNDAEFANILASLRPDFEMLKNLGNADMAKKFAPWRSAAFGWIAYFIIKNMIYRGLGYKGATGGGEVAAGGESAADDWRKHLPSEADDDSAQSKPKREKSWWKVWESEDDNEEPRGASESGPDDSNFPENMHGKGFYYGPSGEILRKGYDGTYEILDNEALLYTSPDGKMKLLPPGDDPSGKWPDYKPKGKPAPKVPGKPAAKPAATSSTAPAPKAPAAKPAATPSTTPAPKAPEKVEEKVEDYSFEENNI